MCLRTWRSFWNVSHSYLLTSFDCSHQLKTGGWQSSMSLTALQAALCGVWGFRVSVPLSWAPCHWQAVGGSEAWVALPFVLVAKASERQDLEAEAPKDPLSWWVRLWPDSSSRETEHSCLEEAVCDRVVSPLKSYTVDLYLLSSLGPSLHSDQSEVTWLSFMVGWGEQNPKLTPKYSVHLLPYDSSKKQK